MLSPRQPARHTPPSEEAILEASRRHSRRLGKIAIDASNVSWKHDETERTARLASGAARREAFARLDALNASYDAAAADAPAPANVTRFRTGLRNIAANMAGGASVMAIALCLSATMPSSRTPPDFDVIPEVRISPSAEVEAMRQVVERSIAIIEAMHSAAGACPAMSP